MESRIFLTTPRSYAAVACSCGHYQKLLGYGKLATSEELQQLDQLALGVRVAATLSPLLILRGQRESQAPGPHVGRTPSSPCHRAGEGGSWSAKAVQEEGWHAICSRHG
jgi:hypothetical protein